MSTSDETRNGSSLRTLALAAHAERWEYFHSDEEDDDREHLVYHQMGRWGAGGVGEIHNEVDARFIAAANPHAVLALLDEIDLLREVLEPPLFAQYEAHREQLARERETNEALSAENDALARENSRLLGVMTRLLGGYEECARLVEKAQGESGGCAPSDTSTPSAERDIGPVESASEPS